MSKGTTRRVQQSEFVASVLDCIAEAETGYEGTLTISVQSVPQLNKPPRLFWVCQFHFPNKGVLERRVKRETGLMVHSYTADPFASLYDVLMRLLRAMESDSQSKFWSRRP